MKRDYFGRNNLASNMWNDNSKDWQRPWSTEELVNQADQWNLACDAALLNTLRAFGDRVLNVSEGVHVKVENLRDNLNQISLRVDLARNDFNSICDSQFVECRVYEEDETLLTEQEQEEKVECNVTEDEKMEDLKNAVDLGLHILDEYYDKLEVPVSDSEEDEEVATPSYVYRRKDLYLHRPLPYVIGSEEWHQKWHVGLLESSDSEIEKSASDKFSDSESDDYFGIKNQSDVSSEFSSVADNLKNRPLGISADNTSTQIERFPSTGGPNLLSNIIPNESTFAEQLAAKLGNIVKENESLGDPEVNRRPIHKKDSDYGSLFSNEPPPIDTVLEDQETGGIFSSGKGLFDDDENDNDTSWISDKSRSTLTTDYLGFGRDGQFGERFQSTGLFDDESDDDIFTENARINNQVKHSYIQHIKPAIPPFHEDPPLLVREKEIKVNKKLAGTVSGFVSSDTFQRSKPENISKNQKGNSSDECDEDNLCPNIMKAVSETKPVSVSEADKISFKSTNEITHSNRENMSDIPKETIEGEHKKSNNLLEGIKPSDPEVIKPKTRTSYLFDDISVDDLFSDAHEEFSSNLFTEEDLFSEENIMKTSEANKKSSTSINTPKKRFSEISDNESFEQKKADFKNHDYRWKNVSNNEIVSLFDDTDEDDSDTFVSNKSNIVNDQSTKNMVQSEVQINSSVGLDIYPEFKPLEKDKLSNDITPQEICRDEFITEIPVDKPDDVNSKRHYDKILENTECKNHEHCNWKNSSNIDEIHTVQDISQKQHLPTVDRTSKYNSTSQSVQTNDTKGLMDYSRSTDIAQVDFLNLTPPGDDGWDDNSTTNIFDYVEPYEIDDFQSQPSSLFDSEPPSLFLNDSNSGVQDVSDNRIDKVKSFGPNVTSSGKFSNDISSGTDGVNCKAFKNIQYQDTHTAIRSQCFSGIPDFSSKSNTDLTAVESSEYTYSSALVNSEDEEIFFKSSDPKDSEKSSQVNVDVLDKRLDFSIKELLCENEINFSDTKRDLGKTDVLNRKRNADISIDIESKINIENGNVISAIGSNADEINTAHSLLDNSFDIEVEYDIFADSDVLLAENEVSSKQSSNEIGANDVSNIYIEKHAEHSSSEKGVTYSDENPNVSYADKFSKKGMNDKVFTLTTTQNNSGISAEHLIETEPITTKFRSSVKKVDSEIGETLTPTANWGDDFSDSSIENENKSISLMHDSYNEERNIQSDLPIKKQDADINNFINRENVISDNASVRKRVSFDDNVVVNENNSRDLSVHQEESDEMQNNISKIVERLNEVSNKQEHNSKVSAVPGKLSHKLDINVGALLPGSAPPRREKTQTPDTETKKLNNEDPDFIRTPISILRTQSETHPITKEYRLEKSVSFDNVGEVEVLLNVTKNRPKIPIKRRPSSRKARQQYLRNSVPEFQLEYESTLEEKIEKRCVKDLSSKNFTHNQPLLVNQVAASKEYINTQNEIIQSLEYLNKKSLEHSLNIEKEMPNELASGNLNDLNPSEEQKNILLFDDEENDNKDLFRIKQSNNRNDINNIERVVLIKEEISSLEPDSMSRGIDELFDPLSDNDEFWSRTTRLSKNKSLLSGSGNTGVNESKSKRNDENVKISTTTLFNSSDEEDDFFSSLSKTKIEKRETNSSKTPSNSNIGSKLFDVERTAQRDIEPSMIKKTLKSSHVEVNEDPLSAMLK